MLPTRPQLKTKLTDYYVCYTRCQYLCMNQDVSELYARLHQEWQEPGNRFRVYPKLDEPDKIAAFLEVISTKIMDKPKNPTEAIQLSFVCWAGIDVVTAQLVHLFGEEDGIGTNSEANDLAVQIIAKEQPTVRLLPASSSEMNTPLPAPLVNFYFPNENTSQPSSVGGDANATLEQLVEAHVEKPFPFFDSTLNKTRQCTIIDVGTSRLRGKWYEVIFDEDEEEAMQITEREMKEIFDAKV
ncbi:hypothetical protein BD410DRAFT_784411, partial [Rickenella mellea]